MGYDIPQIEGIRSGNTETAEGRDGTGSLPLNFLMKWMCNLALQRQSMSVVVKSSLLVVHPFIP
jgi:hypothetical protein